MIAVLCVLYVLFISVTATFTIIGKIVADEEYYHTPSELYNSTEMNVYGCIAVWLLLIMFNPIYVAIWYLVKILYWLCHVGRGK